MVTTRSRAKPGPSGTPEPSEPTPSSSRANGLANSAASASSSRFQTIRVTAEDMQRLREEWKRTPTGWRRIVRDIQDVLMSLHGFCGTYCMAAWETFLIWAVFLLVLSLVLYGAYRQTTHLIGVGARLYESYMSSNGHQEL